SGSGVVENSFDPSLAGIGTHVLTYNWSDGANCNYETTTSVEVQALPTAQIALSADTICLGESITASVANLANENATFQWQLDGEDVGNTAEINLSSFALGGVYDLNLIIESEACTYQVASNIFVGDISLVLDSLPAPISLGDAVTLAATAHSNLDFALNLDWFNETSDELLCADCPALTISPNETSIYTLLATDTQGCTTTLSTTVSVLLPNRVVIPNAFSPNGDGKNDLFRIQGINIVSVDWFIYDRWGYQIAALPNVSATEGWDGQRDGVKVEIGTYIYHVVVYFEDGIVQPVSGHVSLIR
ncbi:MAG: T9SS type B sorting domain-containing protein, partial [Chitinophagales bacterium]